ncbi:MAG: glycosyltransferase [Bryobacterales bacterium]|nr:glycosyltransferase [Bryobacterales bacterium]
MRVALLSPLPPSRSGIADYSSALAEAMAAVSSVDVFSSPSALPDLSVYDAVLYQIGNNGDHGFVYRTALSHPGIVVLHEANLHHLIADITIKQGDWGAYLRAVEADGGAAALEFAQTVRRLEAGPDYDGVPMLRALLQGARGLIVHSEFVASRARENGYTGPLAVIPHGAWLPEPSGGQWRERLGVREDQPLLGVFGHLKPYKRVSETLRAFRRLVRQHPEARLILVGEPHPDFPVEQLIDSLDLRAHARVIGYAPIEEFVGYLDACDIIVNLRFPTVGESSGTMLRAMGLGKPVLVSNVGAFAEFSDDVCLKVPVGGPAEEDLIFEYLRYLVADPEAASRIGATAREWVARECAWGRVAERYLQFCARVAGQTDPAATLPSSEAGDIAKDRIADGGGATESVEQASFPESAMVSSEGQAERSPEEAVEEEVLVEEAAARLPLDVPALLLEDIPAPVIAEAEAASSLENPLAAELLSWASGSDAREYLMQHLSRLVTTLELLPEGGQDRSVLEMGCYLQITPALRWSKHYGEIRGCYYGPVGEAARRSIRATDGRVFECDVDAFDAERDAYPYAEGTFDVVLCTELFEHLGYDPMHCLLEIHRVLKPGGRLLLSTPNACSLRAIAAILGQYHPGFFPAFMRPTAAGGIDPRHHREYAPREIDMALTDAGFTVEQLRTAPYWSAPEPQFEWVRHLLDRYELDPTLRGECIFALARKSGSPANRYPDWLYYG